MLKSCPRCGRIHPYGQTCQKNRKLYTYEQTEEQKLRSSTAWKEKREQVKREAHYLCEWCYHQGRINAGFLEVHHIEKLREKPEKLCEDTNLVVLCRECHKLADAGLIAPKELKKTARERIRRTEAGAPMIPPLG